MKNLIFITYSALETHYDIDLTAVRASSPDPRSPDWKSRNLILAIVQTTVQYHSMEFEVHRFNNKEDIIIQIFDVWAYSWVT